MSNFVPYMVRSVAVGAQDNVAELLVAVVPTLGDIAMAIPAPDYPEKVFTLTARSFSHDRSFRIIQA
jgi:hypothetical protein